MENYFKYFISTSIAILLTVAIMLLAVMCVKAQDNSGTMQRAPASVNVDGVIREWGDSLALYEPKTKLSYTIANNDTDLYVVIFAADEQIRRKIMAAGITVSVNPDGKKKKTYSLTYPLPDKNTMFKRNMGDGDDVPAKAPSLLQSTSIKVEGLRM